MAVVLLEQKYSKDGDFKEPCVLCDRCNQLLLVYALKHEGMCPHCGNTRVRNVRVMTDHHMRQAQAWAASGVIDAEWLKLFEPRQDPPHFESPLPGAA
jgi:hypothetical protein